MNGARPNSTRPATPGLSIGPDGGYVGYGACLPTAPTFVSLRWVSRTHFYGQGIGSTLVNLMEERAREHVPLAPSEARVYL